MAARTIITLAGVSLALAACNSSGNGGAIPAEAGDPGPLGLVFETEVDVISSDHQNSVRVSEELASMELVSLDLVAGTFEIVLGLPDGTSVTLTDDDLDLGDVDMIDLNGSSLGGDVIIAELENDAGDVVQVAIGLGLGAPSDLGDLEPEDADEALFMLTRVDDADPDNGDSVATLNGGYYNDDEFDVYMLTGVETETLPRGWATYSGKTIATAYVGGDLVSSYFIGSAYVAADFANSSVDVALEGEAYIGDGLYAGYDLVGQDLAVEGSRYRGALGIVDGAHHVSEFYIESYALPQAQCIGECGPYKMTTTTEIAGDLIGAFYGENAEATAGVFAAEETGHEAAVNGADVEIVGGYGAYADVLEDQPEDLVD